jgi:hypothetical protein
MPYDEKLDARIGEVLADWGTTRKKMFGGTCYLLQGNMVCGVYKDNLILRLGDAAGVVALEEPHVSPFDITGRPMKGWVMVKQAGFEGEKLCYWIEKARQFVKRLPPK